VVDGAAEALGGLDCVVSNAGIDVSDWVPVHEWDVEAFDEILRVNLRGPFLVAKYALPHLLAAGGGSIVHMSSVCAITVWAGDCGYDISKAGLNMLSDHIAVEYGPRGVRSNTLMPGVIETELHRSVMDSMEGGAEMEAELLTKHPIGRFGQAEEVADACVLLCADEAGFMTGANISIDGGYSRV
jgi:NAD(P)-dependent dehydrogenase (short-subunit alcohol dehydrogenase family)